MAEIDDGPEPVDPAEFRAAEDAIRRHLEERGLLFSCARCGGGNLASAGDVAVHIISGRNNPGGPNIGHGSIHAATLSCNRCGHLELFDYEVLEPRDQDRQL